MDAKFDLGQQWVCNNLEELQCHVVGFDHFIDIARGVLERVLSKQKRNEPFSKVEEAMFQRWKDGQDLKRAFFKQVSMMKSLKRLAVSYDSRTKNIFKLESMRISELPDCYISERDGNTYFQYKSPPDNTLTMKLDDGLDQLASLTKLEYLWFEFIDHGMGREEIEWIATNLPSLKEMRGLKNGAHIGLEPNPKNKKLLKLMMRLREDIIHSRQFVPSKDKCLNRCIAQFAQSIDSYLIIAFEVGYFVEQLS
ncbi:hypothetical protein BGZ76_002455 [Entomortierella beljakovae]|nr:hypothetical protein BGZ76_002455 [Entomortierella beljakovae]